MFAVVSDASPLIALEKIGLLAHLGPLFAELWIPPAVEREIAPTVQSPPWIVTRPLSSPLESGLVEAALGAGETEAIALAIESGRCPVILDELAGRKKAQELNLPVIGTLGLILEAKRYDIVHDVGRVLRQLLETGFFVSPVLVQEILIRAGES